PRKPVSISWHLRMEDNVLDISEATALGRELPPLEIPEGLVEALITAVSTALGEMARTDVSAHKVQRGTVPRALEELGVAVPLQSRTQSMLMLVFPGATALALATRILPDTAQPIDEWLVRDCMSEIANVVAGQAKALLAGTPHEFTFALPKVVAAVGPI